ncbi:hypothetical protein BH23VER1_BH23VER1_05360 [soil metagenome]
MHLSIDYRTIYQYVAPVSFSPHTIRIFPRAELNTRVLSMEFSTNEGTSVRYRRDLFDNVAAHCFYPDSANLELRIFLSAELEITETNPFDFLLDPTALELPLSYAARQQEFLAPFLRQNPPDAALELPGWALPRFEGPTVDILTDLLASFHQNIQYEERLEGEARPPKETIHLRRGACRDVALLFQLSLRRAGIANRLVSGYLVEFDTAPGSRTAQGTFHAWNEVCLPGAGWIALDPTNNVFGGHNYIATAVGLTSDDIAPVSGSYFGDTHVPSSMHFNLSLQQGDDSP